MGDSILKLLEKPTEDATAGECHGKDVVIRWDVDGLDIEQPGGKPAHIRVSDKDIIAVQLSRSQRTQSQRSSWDLFWGKPPGVEHLLHVELRVRGAPRFRFLAVTERERLEGLPYLEKPGASIPARGLIALVRACLQRGANLARFETGMSAHGRHSIAGLSFHEGRAAFQAEDGLWGYVDEKGRVVVPPRYTKARRYAEGRALVAKDGKWGLLDASGVVLVAPCWDEARDFIQGTAEVRVGTWWQVVDLNGQVLLEKARSPVNNDLMIVGAFIAATGLSLLAGMWFFAVMFVPAGVGVIWYRRNRRWAPRALPREPRRPTGSIENEPLVRDLRASFADSAELDEEARELLENEVISIRELMRRSDSTTAIKAALAVARYCMDQLGGEPHGALDYETVLLWPAEAGADDYACIDVGPPQAGDGTIRSLDCVAPEIASGEPPVKQSDVYSVGCLLYGLLAGRPVYEGSEFSTLMQHTRGSYTPLKERLRQPVDDGVIRLVERAMHNRPERRPLMADFRRKLEKALGA